MRLDTPPADSYYAASASPRTARAPLRGSIVADIAIVGGGIAGLSAALHFAKRGYRTVVLEARFVGFGASGRSGGQAIFGFAASQQTLRAAVGAEDARRLFNLSVDALNVTQSLIRDYRIDCDYHANHIHVAAKQRQVHELQAWLQELHQDYGYESARFLNKDALARHVRSDRYLAGLLDPHSGHLHPLKYTQGLARAAESEGAAIYEDTQVTGYANGPAVSVHARHGNVRCATLVLCGNAYLGRIAPALARRILGIGTYIIATEPLPAAHLAGLLPSNAAVADMNWILDYFRRSDDHRLLFGGRVSYSSVQPRRLAASMRKRMVRVFPALRDARVGYAWGGYLDITRNRAPDFGRLAPNVYFVQGFSGHGITLTGLAGQLLAEAVAGTTERFDVFARIPHRNFPGGPLLRRPSLILAMLYYRLRDLL